MPASKFDGFPSASGPDPGSTYRVLQVEDNPSDARLVQEALRDSPLGQFEIDCVDRLDRGVEYLGEHRPDVVLLDLDLPDSGGTETVIRLREARCDSPIVVLTGTDDVSAALDTIRAGAQDFVYKERINTPMVLGETLRFAIERSRLETRITYLAQYDTLTGLANRNLFQDRLTHALAERHRRRDRLALLYVDLDLFKEVNDALGHAAGDEILRQVGQRLQSCVRESDSVARIGGDEFILILTMIRDIEDVATVARKVLDRLEKPMTVKDRQILMSASIGISVCPDNGDDEESLLKNADSAMYRSKESGRGKFCFYATSMNSESLERLLLGTSLRRAVTEDQFDLHFQPIVSLQSGTLRGAEALLRWSHPEWGHICPTEILRLTRQVGTIEDLELWVVRTGLEQMAAWATSPGSLQFVSINLSASRLQAAGFVRELLGVLRRHQPPPGFLQIEITEASLIEHFDHVESALNALRETGVRVAVDDFGVGHSSLSYLHRLPIDTLKIDRSFISQLPQDPKSIAIVRTMIELGRSLGLEVVAEGVETRDQAAFLLEHGCDLGQGFLYGIPEQAGRMTERLDPGGQS